MGKTVRRVQGPSRSESYKSPHSRYGRAKPGQKTRCAEYDREGHRRRRRDLERGLAAASPSVSRASGPAGGAGCAESASGAEGGDDYLDIDDAVAPKRHFMREWGKVRPDRLASTPAHTWADRESREDDTNLLRAGHRQKWWRDSSKVMGKMRDRRGRGARRFRGWKGKRERARSAASAEVAAAKDWSDLE